MLNNIILSLLFLFGFVSVLILIISDLRYKVNTKNDKCLIVKNRIYHVRQDNNLSVEQLADLCGTTPNTINSIENETFVPPLKLVLILSIVLKEDVENLFYISAECMSCEKSI